MTDVIGHCDYCTDELKSGDSLILYICSESDHITIKSKNNDENIRFYCTNCGPRKLEYPSNSHFEALILLPKLESNSTLKFIIFDKEIMSTINWTLLDKSQMGVGFNWDITGILDCLYVSQSSPILAKARRMNKNPLGVIDMLDHFGVSISIFVDEDKILAKGNNKELLNYVRKIHNKNVSYFRKEFNYNEKMAEDYGFK